MNTKNLKPFDLKAALKGEPVMLRDGRKAFIRHHETEIPMVGFYHLWGVVCGDDENHVASGWCEDGRYHSEYRDSGKDIIGMWPKTRIINGFEVPAPEKIAPKKHNTTYFHANVSHDYFHISYVWMGDRADLQALKRGLVFLNKEDAISNAKAMLGINPYEEDEE